MKHLYQYAWGITSLISYTEVLIVSDWEHEQMYPYPFKITIFIRAYFFCLDFLSH